MKGVDGYRTSNGCGSYSDSYQTKSGDAMATLTKHTFNTKPQRWSVAYWSRSGERHGEFEYYRNKTDALRSIKEFLGV